MKWFGLGIDDEALKNHVPPRRWLNYEPLPPLKPTEDDVAWMAIALLLSPDDLYPAAWANHRPYPADVLYGVFHHGHDPIMEPSRVVWTQGSDGLPQLGLGQGEVGEKLDRRQVGGDGDHLGIDQPVVRRLGAFQRLSVKQLFDVVVRHGAKLARFLGFCKRAC